MPQMFPLNWLFHFFFFMTLFSMTLILNYFIFLMKMKFKPSYTKKIYTNPWKW
uniref:ATP synthase F0 subunit 8 n=1 Tax=Athalia scapulata TaxID=2950356 RepID=A0A977TL53_9HYME|nr:ATP synthase F0 subunit 8 [Athalia scapulata]UXW93402.1 ATP synthase F0 subunit 8 [Athalia scapulata]